MILSASRLSPNSIRNRLVDWVARIPARVRTKLLAGFLSIAGLLIVLGAVGLNVLGGVNQRTEELIMLQRKIAAYRQVQHDTTNQLYAISTALLFTDERMLDTALRQLNQFGYDLDRMAFVAAGEKEILTQVRQDFERLAGVVKQVAEMTRAGRSAEARELQRAQSVPLADRLERQTNQLVNIAAAGMVAAIDATERAYRASRLAVILFALGSILLALGLGYIISSALIEPVNRIEDRLRRIAAGDFAGRVEVANRDELGALAANLNQTSEELGRLYREIEARNRELSEALEQQTATSTILRVIAASPTDIQPVLNAVAESAAKLCDAYDAVIMLADGDALALRAHHGPIPIDFPKWPISRDWVSGRAVIDRKPVHVHDLMAAGDEFPNGHAMAVRLGFHTILAVPLLREGEAIGAIFVRRTEARDFTEKQIDLLSTFADQAVIAIQNLRLFEEVQARTHELSEALNQQTATAEVLQVISRSAFDLDTVLNTLVRTAIYLCDAARGAIWLRKGDRFPLAAHAGVGEEWVEFAQQNPIVPAADSPMLAGVAAFTGEIVNVEDIPNDPRFRAFEVHKMGDYRGGLAVPLKREGRIEGVIGLSRPEARLFTPRQCQLVQTFADQAVIAIENVRLFEEVRQRTTELSESLRYQTATAHILRIISQSPTDVQPVFDAIVLTAVRLLGSDMGVMMRCDGVTFSPVAIATSEGLLSDLGPSNLPIDPSLNFPSRAIVARQMLHVPDWSTIDVPEHERRISALYGTNSSLYLPLIRDSACVGLLAMGGNRANSFGEKEIAQTQAFADQAVIAIENVRLFEEVQARTRDLSESLQQQTATAEVLQVISRSAFDLDAVLQTLVESAARLCNTGPAQIWRRDGDVYRLAASQNQSPEYLSIEKQQEIGPGRGTLVGRVAVERRAVQILDLWTDPEYEHKDDARIGNLRSALGVPLLRGGEPIGMFMTARYYVEPFSDREVALITTFADQAVIAIENVRLFEEVQARTGELARSVGELKALGEVSQAVNSTLDLKTVLETIVAKAVQLSQTDAGAIYVYSKSSEKFRLRATYGMSEELTAAITGQTVGLHDAGIGEAARNQAPLQMPDLSQGVPSPLHQIVLDAGYRSVLIVPLLRPNKVVGALVVRRKTPGEFSESTVQLIQTFAAQSVLAIQNARLFSEIEEKGQQLEIASRHKSQFLANMSHELRTPLNSVLGFSEMLADGLYGELPEKAKATLARIQANGKHLLGLINDVLDLAKIEAGQLTLTIDDYSIGQIVKTVAATAEPLARAKGLTLTATVAEGLPIGRGDERRLSQVLLNLAGNAVKFTDKGSVDIAAGARDGQFEVLVRDTGPGIAPEHQSRIFEEFQQVDESSTRQKGGTGLGLAISKRIVEMHGGTIGLDSALGSGSTFRIAIPVRARESVKAA